MEQKKKKRFMAVKGPRGHESVESACEAYDETLDIRNPNKHMRFDKLKLEGCPMV